MFRDIVRVWQRLRSFVRRASIEREMSDEMRFHIEMEAADLRRSGIGEQEASRRARAAFGGIERHKEDVRDSVGVRLFDDLSQDVRYAARQLRASPGFSAATLLTLALGIGATTTIYTLVRATTAQPFAFPNVDRLVHVAQGQHGRCASCFRMATGNYATVRDESRTLSDVSLVASWSPIFRGAERTEVLQGAQVTPVFFNLLGVHAMLGRTIAAGDTTSELRNVVVLSEPLWRTQFGGDSSIIGRSIVLDAVPRTVIGVIEARFVFPHRTTVWVPRVLQTADIEDRSWTNDDVFARLSDGATLEQARAELAAMGDRIAASYPSTMKNWTFDAMPFAEWQTPNGGEELVLMGIAVALVLLIACINLAGLLVARLTVRRKEIAVRAAMGADGGRIARQLLTETILLTVIAGALGAAVAALATNALRNALPSFIIDSIPGLSSLSVDVAALLISLGIGGLTGIAIGIWPALRFARPSLVGELKDGARNATSSGGVSRGRRALVVAEVAFAIVLLVAAGLLARSVRNMYAVRPGFQTSDLLTLRLNAPPRAPGDNTPLDSARFDRLVEQLRVTPGVQRAAAVFGLPYSHSASTNVFEIEGRPPLEPTRRPSVRMVPATADYFSTLELPVIRGRAFTHEDKSNTMPVAIIDEALARRFFANEDPIGRVLVISKVRWQIVGVVAEANHGIRSRRDQDAGEIYRPMAQWPWRSIQLVVRTNGDPMRLAPAVMQVVREFDRDLGITRVMTMEALINDDIAPDRTLAGMMIGFALAAVLISAIGLYGVISYGVAQRMREFGIRRALGADAASLLALVLGQGVRLATLGAAIGILGAVGVTRLMGAMLFGVSPTDPLTLAAVAVSMCVVGVAASYWPARRATRVDPMTSLREE